MGCKKISKRNSSWVDCTHADANDPDDGHCSSLDDNRAKQGPKGAQKTEQSKSELTPSCILDPILCFVAHRCK